MKVVIDVENSVAPEGYEFTGALEVPNGRPWCSVDGRAMRIQTDIPRPILRKKRWRAEGGGVYLAVLFDGAKFKATTIFDDAYLLNNRHWESNNYFHPTEEADLAQNYADRLNAVKAREE